MLTRVDGEMTDFAVSIINQSIYSKINIAELTRFVFQGNMTNHSYALEEVRNHLIFIKEKTSSSIKLNISSLVLEVLNFTLSIKSSYFKIDNLDQTRTKMYSIIGEDYLCCGDSLRQDYYGADARVAISIFNSMNTSIELNISSRFNFETVEINASSLVFTHFILPERAYFVENYNIERSSWLSQIYITTIEGRVNITYSMDGEDKGIINPNYVDPGFGGWVTPFEIWMSLIIFWLVVVSIAILVIYLMVKKASYFKGEKLKN